MNLRERILVVDDAPTVRQALKLMLEESGYTVDLAAGAGEALAGIAAERYDLLLVDKNLDGEDGFAVCRAARERCPDTARILITADQSVESAIQAVEEDIFAYLTKPLRKQQVLLRVRRALDRVRLTREREEARAEMQSAKEALERRTDELEHTLQRLVRAQARLAESEKLVSVGMLAAGVAHEINNPACFILPNLEYIKRSAHTLAQLLDDDGSAAAPPAPAAGRAQRAHREVEHIDRMVDRCLEGLRRIRKVVGTLQLFSRRDATAAAAIDLNALCVSLLDLVAHELGDRARLEVDLRPIPPVQGHEKQLAEAVLNLLLNARRSVFAAPSGRPHCISLQTELREDQVVLCVTDTGAALRQQVGDPALDTFFFGTGDAETGPGLSLSLVGDIFDRHGGRLALTSDEEGNRFEAFLPVGAHASGAEDADSHDDS